MENWEFQKSLENHRPCCHVTVRNDVIAWLTFSLTPHMPLTEEIGFCLYFMVSQGRFLVCQRKYDHLSSIKEFVWNKTVL